MPTVRQRIARWLAPTEHEQRAQGYTATIQQAVARAIRDPGTNAAATAAVEFAYGLMSRAFAVATVTGDVLASVDRAAMILDLLTRGNSVWWLRVQSGRATLHRVAHYDVQGGYDPSTWRYTLSLPGPTASVTMPAPAASVVHVRYGATADRPWLGVSPLAAAGISADILAQVEEGFRRETSQLHVGLITHPSSYLPNEQARGEFAAALAAAERQTLVQSGNEGWRSGSGSGAAGQWQQVRLGPSPDPGEAALREQIAADVLQAIGIPAGLYLHREGSVSRESYRQLLSATIEPYAALCADELSRVLERPVRFDFHRLAAADIAARARAYGSLIQAGATPESAAMIAGLDDLETAPEPEPDELEQMTSG